jgi:hypothetical protein
MFREKKHRSTLSGIAKAVIAMRRRLDFNTFEFSRMVGFSIAQIEDRDIASSSKLIALLRFAVTAEERNPLLDALGKHGVKASDLSPELLGGAPDEQVEGVHA